MYKEVRWSSRSKEIDGINKKPETVDGETYRHTQRGRTNEFSEMGATNRQFRGRWGLRRSCFTFLLQPSRETRKQKVFIEHNEE
jgi:hypothetical protein